MATRPISLNKYSTSSSSGDMSFDKPPSEDMQKPPIIYESKLSHTHTMIVLHGRGDTGQRFGAFFTISTINDEALDEILAHTKFIFPSAKRRRVMAASSEHIITMNQWFDIESLKDTNRGEVVQIEGLRDSSLHVREIIEEELNVIPAENIVLVGLSQGCATALFTLLTYRIPNPGKKDPPPRLGAVVGMSGWLPFEKRIVELLSAIQDDEKEVTSESNATQATSSEHLANATDSKKKPQPFSVAVSNKALSTICTLCSLPPFSVPNSPSTSTLPHTPVFMGHGTSDEKVSPELGEKARDTLRMLGFEVEWFPYQGFGHWYKEPDEIDDMIKFLAKTVGIDAVDRKPTEKDDKEIIFENEAKGSEEKSAEERKHEAILKRMMEKLKPTKKEKNDDQRLEAVAYSPGGS